jgi:hypothetical protein
MFVCCECWVLSGRGLCDGLITRPGESYRLWRVVVCVKETSKTRSLKPATGLWKTQPHCVVTPGKQTTTSTDRTNDYATFCTVKTPRPSKFNVSGQSILQKVTRKNVFVKQTDMKFGKFLKIN